MRYTILILLFIIGFTQKNKASQNLYFIDSVGVIIDSCEYTTSSVDSVFEDFSRPNPIIQFFKKKQKKNKKIMAAILAFPFPFGIVGLHRIYLGTAPHVPIVYIGTFGGVLGILPFIDFCVIILDKDFDRYLNNKKIFMWVK